MNPWIDDPFADLRKSAVNKRPKSGQAKKSSKVKFNRVKKKIVDYVLTDCNSEGVKIINKSNIHLLIDEDAKKIIIEAVNGGNMCLSNISEDIIKDIAIEEGLPYDIDLKA